MKRGNMKKCFSSDPLHRPCPDSRQRHAEALRDFFLSRNGIELERACHSLEGLLPVGLPPIEGWLAAEFAFNRLFVGPAALEAPPYASAYLDPESLVMGATTLEVRDMFSSLGLESPWKNVLPDDHVSLELDGAVAVEHAVSLSGSSGVLELRDRFHAHMKTWMPLFIERIRGAPSGHPAISHVADSLAVWLVGLDEEGGETQDCNAKLGRSV